MDNYNAKVIAHIYNSFDTKFAVPRQSGLTDETRSEIIFEKQYRDENALRGLEGFSHLWLIWYFSQNKKHEWSPTVRPPRLGGNKRIGVFATRSPYRPNPLGLSSVRLVEIKKTSDNGAVLVVSGADLINGTPILDIKPYLTFSDCHTDAKDGFAGQMLQNNLDVVIPDDAYCDLDSKQKQTLISLLSQDPRPAYIDDENRVFGFRYENHEIKFTVNQTTLIVKSITKL